jgi:hypothetical protein
MGQSEEQYQRDRARSDRSVDIFWLVSLGSDEFKIPVQWLIYYSRNRADDHL